MIGLRKKIALLPFRGKDMPHLVLEPNQKCNFKCTACYKHKSNYSKPFSEVIEDIDFAISKRNLDSIAILGGEPTLYPDLPDVIRYISDKGIQVKILTNGSMLTDELLEQYKEAGLDIIFLNIDRMQNRPDLPPNPTQNDVCELRDKLFGMIAKHNIRCGLVVTLYQNTLDDFAEDVRYVISSKNVCQMLVTNYFCFDVKPLIEKYIPQNEETKHLYEWLRDEKNYARELEVAMEDAERVIYDNLGLRPDAYISSNKDASEKRWIFYHLHTLISNDGTYRVLPLEDITSKYFVDIYERVYRLIYGKYSFAGRVYIMNGSKWVGLISALLTLNPLYVYRTLSTLALSFMPGAKYMDKIIFVQRPPNLTETGEAEYCKDCPDATVRNGQIVPVCIADIISPINLKEYSEEVQQGYRRLREHLKIEL